MIQSLKANARRKRRPFDRKVEARGPVISPAYLSKASEEQLAYWRERALKEQRAQWRRIGLALLLLALVLLGMAVRWW